MAQNIEGALGELGFKGLEEGKTGTCSSSKDQNAGSLIETDL